MNDQDQIETKRQFKPRGKGCLRWPGIGLVGFLSLLLVGYIYEPIAEAAEDCAYLEEHYRPHPILGHP